MANYDSSVFLVKDVQAAKNIILTPEHGFSTDERWERETAFIQTFITDCFLPNSHILDFGCGIGRLSKVLCDAGFAVTGVDISPPMRRMATNYVNSERFRAISVADLMKDDTSYDGVVCAWVLQHVNDLDGTVDLIAANVTPAAPLVLINRGRCIPVKGGWEDDGKDVAKSLSRKFVRVGEIKPDPKTFVEGTVIQTWIEAADSDNDE